MEDLLIAYLEQRGVGTIGTTLFAGYMPAVDDAATIIPTGGFPPEARYAVDISTYQVFTRGSTYPVGRARALAVYNALQSLGTIELGGVYITDIQFTQSAPIALGRNENDTSEFSQNFRVRHTNAGSQHRE